MGKNITIINIQKTALNPESKQVEKDSNYIWVLYPEISFESLLKIYYGSFIASWITDKTATSVQSWFETKDESLKTVLNNIDLDFLVRSLLVCWNAFFEVIRDWTWKVSELLPVLTDEVKVMEGGDGYIQKVWSKQAYFNKFTPIKEKPEKTAIYEASKAWEKELKETDNGCGFNPNLNEIFHFKILSLKSKYYWDSFFGAAIDQILLLQNIDKFYKNYFDNAAIKPKLLADKSWQMTDETKKQIEDWFETELSWVNNAFSTVVVPGDVAVLDMTDNFNTEDFIKYRQELIKSIAIKLNIPYDLIITDNSNRASSTTAIEQFNNYTIKPLQKRILKDLKTIFADHYKVDDLEFAEIDTKDQKEEMEIYTWLVEAGIMTEDEARERLWLPKLETLPKQDEKEYTSKKMNNFYWKLKKEEDDLTAYLSEEKNNKSKDKKTWS